MKTIQLTGSPKFVYKEPRRIPTYMAAIIRRQRFIIIAIICVVLLIVYSWRFQRTENFVLNSTPVEYIKGTFNEAEKYKHFIHIEEIEEFASEVVEEIKDKFPFHISDAALHKKVLKPHLETKLLSQPKDNIVVDTYMYLEETLITVPHDDQLVSLSAIQQPEGFPPPDVDNEWMKTKHATTPHLETELLSQLKDNIVADTKYIYLEETLTTVPHNDQLVSLSAIQQPEEGFPPPDVDNEWMKTEHVTFSMSSNITDIIDININKQIPLNEQVYSSTESHTVSTDDIPVLLVDTPGCKIPKLDPWDPSVRDLIELKDPYVCPGLPAFMESNPGGTITVNRSLLEMYYNITPEELTCYYQSIYRVHEVEEVREVSIAFGNMVKLEFGNPMKEDYVNVSCDIKGNNYDQHLTLVPLKESVEEERNSLNPPNPTLNVILIGIDSVSKLNFLRHFPQTHAFLREKLKPFEMNGYTKVAENTFPNIVPLLTGQFVEHWWNETLMDTMYFDNVSFIWKEYAKRGYRTFFAEDAPHIGIFNYFKRGFYNPPTDYYYHPMALAVENRKFSGRQPNYFCLDSQLEFDFIFDYLKLFAQTMGTRPNFGFTMVSAITHDDLNYAGWADGPTVRLLEGLSNTGVLNNTLLVLFSDHGLRYGKICRTYVGKYEERLPLMYIHVPKWFLDQYPEIAKNLHVNQNRLMTLFDVHATMLHLLDLSKSEEDRSMITLGKSLFEEISPNRTCVDAHIETHWCPCQEFDIADSDRPEVINATQAIVDDINSKLQPYVGKCEILEVDTISDARIGKANEMVLKFWKTENDVINKTIWIADGVPSIDDYMITLTTKPGGGVFEGTVRHNPYDNSYNVLGVNRISMYGNTSWCIDSVKMKLFCYCKIQLT